jgi:hypothetical protein
VATQPIPARSTHSPAPWDRNCFIHQMIGKVRIHLTKNKLPGDFREARGKCRILIAVSGGPSSRAMLDIVAQYNGEVTNEQARRFGGLHIAHIDEQALGHPSFKVSMLDLPVGGVGRIE